MALFGAPLTRNNDPHNAVSAALSMEAMLITLNQRLQKEGYSPISIGIGIHSGSVVAGNMGSENRLNYTVIGDNVNLCSRLEGLTKFYGVSIIVSAQTKLHCEDLHFLFLDRVQVKGKKEAVSIYMPSRSAIPEQELSAYNTALEYYQKGNFKQAAQSFAQLHIQYKRILYRTYQDRCLAWIETPPSSWEGIYKFQSK